MDSILLLPLLLSFLTGLFLMPFWIRKAKEIGLVWEDMNKPEHPRNVAGSGGVSMFLSFVIGVLTYIAIKTFYFNSKDNLIEIFALLSVIFVIAFIGIIDDILGWRRGGLSIRSRLALLFFASIPLIVINAGESVVMGINLGLLYPILLIPIGIVGASATFNFLAGYNGLESSQGIIILSALSGITYLTGEKWLSVITLCMVVALIPFYVFNKHPAKVFPGNILTYSVGALIAGIAILGKMEKIAVFFFIPYIIEVVLKVRGKLKKQSFAKVNSDGSLDLPYEKIYGLEHLAIYILKKIKPHKKVYENDVVYLINFFQILVIIAGILLFWGEIIA
ncbi:glycosyl transferase family 4 [Candidatus Pacearchaeota archaeon]|jgi:UDP-N-acetylglucosamine--dolichyl-phosphate N-acetylglucosaminephosphotransferase|nr:glycosyl transferase family 4 [Candidatus Pacearchaeota archaeon]